MDDPLAPATPCYPRALDRPGERPSFLDQISSSPLSTQGRIAREFSKLLRDMWSNEPLGHTFRKEAQQVEDWMKALQDQRKGTSSKLQLCWACLDPCPTGGNVVFRPHDQGLVIQLQTNFVDVHTHTQTSPNGTVSKQACIV